jgi:hypothetical protein
MVEALAALHALFVRYNDTVSNDILTRSHATLLTLHTLTHYLSVKIDTEQAPIHAGDTVHGRPLLEQYCIPAFGELANELEGLTYFDRGEYERAQAANSYFREFNAHAARAKKGILFIDESTTMIDKYAVYLAPSNGQFWQGLIENDSVLTKKVDELAANQIHCLSLTEKDAAISKKIVDWPDSIKRTVILEAAVLLEANPLMDQRYSHIVYLRRITHSVGQMMYGAPEYFSLKGAPMQTYGVPGVSKGSCRRKCTEDHTKSVRKGLHRTGDPEPAPFLAHSRVRRNKSAWKRPLAEGDTLLTGAPRDEKNRISPSLAKELLRIASEWKLTPHQMIYKLSEDFSSLINPELQAVVIELCFRSPIGKDGIAHLGTGELILKDDALFTSATEFVNKGFMHFYRIKKKANASKEAIDGGRFFLEFAFYLSKYLHDGQETSKSEALQAIAMNAINRWLQEPSITVQEVAILHQYRLLFFSLQRKEDAPRTVEECVAIYQSWTAYNLSLDDGIWRSPVLLAIERNMMLTFTAECQLRFAKDLDFRNAVGMGVIKNLELESDEEQLQWMYNTKEPNQLVGQRPSGEMVWEIDLVSGEVYSSMGKIGQEVASRPWESQADFKRIFSGDTSFRYRAIGNNVVTFKHPTMGMIRLVPFGSGCEKKHAIQRQFPGGADLWFECKDREIQEDHNKEKYSGYIPILKSDQSYWIPIRAAPKGRLVACKDLERSDELQNDSSSEKKEEKIKLFVTGYFVALKGQKLCYATMSDGSILTVDPKTGNPNIDGPTIDMLAVKTAKSSDTVAGLSQFEEVGNILCFHTPQGQLSKVSFPRYTSQEGNPLEFVSKQGKMVWSENSQYHLPQEMPKGYLGTIPNYLYLQSSDTKSCDKILVPFQPILSDQIPIPQGTIKIANKDPQMGKDYEESQQWGLFKYFVFNVVNGEIKPTSLESQLYLAYLLFAQRDYAQAIFWLEKIRPTVTLSSMSMKLLELIQEQPLTLIPTIIFLANRKMGNRVIKKLHANPKRLYQYLIK